jgi:hypothetical protein
MIFLLMALFVVVKSRGHEYDDTAWLFARVGLVEASAELIGAFSILVWAIVNA